MFTKNREFLNQFREEYITKKATELANNSNFIKRFILNQMAEYTTLLSRLVTKNKDEFKKFINDKKNEKFFTILGFIFAIPKIIDMEDPETNINEESLERNFFKISDEEQIKNLKLNLKAIDNTFESVIFNAYESNFSTLYKSGEFILNFLKVRQVRKEVAIYLLKQDSTFDNPEFEEELNEWIIQKQIKMNNNVVWNSNQTIRNFL